MHLSLSYHGNPVVFFQTVHYIPEIESTIRPIMELDWYTTASKKF